MKNIIKSKQELIKHKKVARQTHNKNNLIFEKKTQLKKHKKEQHKPNIKCYHITGPLKEIERNHTPTSGLTHQRGRPEPNPPRYIHAL